MWPLKRLVCVTCDPFMVHTQVHFLMNMDTRDHRSVSQELACLILVSEISAVCMLVIRITHKRLSHECQEAVGEVEHGQRKN